MHIPYVVENVDGLTVEEVAAELTLHPETVRRLVRRKLIEAKRSMRFGHPYLIAPAEVKRIKEHGIDYSKAL